LGALSRFKFAQLALFQWLLIYFMVLAALQACFFAAAVVIVVVMDLIIVGLLVAVHLKNSGVFNVPSYDEGIFLINAQGRQYLFLLFIGLQSWLFFKLWSLCSELRKTKPKEQRIVEMLKAIGSLSLLSFSVSLVHHAWSWSDSTDTNLSAVIDKLAPSHPFLKTSWDFFNRLNLDLFLPSLSSGGNLVLVAMICYGVQKVLQDKILLEQKLDTMQNDPGAEHTD